MLNINDYVILKNDYKGLVKNSVGVVEEVLNNNVYRIFFIGKRIELKLGNNEVDSLNIRETGKPFEYKICNVCHILKKYFVDFEINQTDALGRKTTRPSCRTCRIKINGIALLNSERKRMSVNKPSKFFICPLCEKGSIPHITANLVIDHDHDNGMARAWICDSCNTGLGRFKDDISLLKKAIKYLEKYTNQNS